jgi:hypothetical protein
MMNQYVVMVVKEVSLRRTAIARGDSKVKEEESPEKNPLGDKLLRILKVSDFGCQTKSVIKLVSVLSNVPISYFKELTKDENKVPDFSGIIVIPVANTNSHEYPLHVPVMSRKDYDSYIMITGIKGNHLNSSETRYATDTEIEQYFTGLMAVSDYWTIETVPSFVEKIDSMIAED